MIGADQPRSSRPAADINECDFFTLDPVAYAPALGEAGMASYRVKLDERAAALGPQEFDRAGLL